MKDDPYLSRFAARWRRECQIAGCRRAQSVGLRAVKWAGRRTAGVRFQDQTGFGRDRAGRATVGGLVNFSYRSETKTWTRARGGWNALAAGRD